MLRSGRRRAAAAIAVALALGVPTLLSGCSIVQNAVEGASGDKVDIGGPSVPKSYPTDEVPLVDGEVVYGAGLVDGKDKSWAVTVKVADAAAFDTISNQLTTAAGFTAASTPGADADGRTGTFAKAPYTVILLVTEDKQLGWIADYTVSYAEPTASASPSASPAG
ncbi:hypothetical protein [Schumannella sp. 10F1B-5-1]|uniref:hypothetical protein n=1 Tax=Schumannella sp. 10F1B-5-1 TaxID=2590780 RepID=UPI00113224F7|nr:hypothetical protein [Schumannella sp. 10F1B-5-1]TPW73123.1 hypothetical protein FJ658_07735 [Schumannella sp. 10F1B-5-1]